LDGLTILKNKNSFSKNYFHLDHFSFVKKELFYVLQKHKITVIRVNKILVILSLVPIVKIGSTVTKG